MPCRQCDWVVVSHHDHGMGLEKESIEELFEFPTTCNLRIPYIKYGPKRVVTINIIIPSTYSFYIGQLRSFNSKGSE